MPIDDKEKNKPVSAPAPPVSEPGANEYTLTGDTDTDFDNIAKHYKPKDLDDDTWRGVWKSVLSGESGGDLSTQESTYGKLPKGSRAFGPMQVLPSTAKGLGFSDEELKDPMYNFMAGVKNLRTDWDEIGKFKGVTSPEHRATLTLAAYHAGRGRVEESLNRGEDGVPDVDDGGINTRDYTFNKVKFIQDYLKEAGVAQSDEPRLITDEEAGARTEAPTDESGQPVSGVMQKRAGSAILGDLTKPAPLKTFEEELVESDRRTREGLGLIVPSSAPRKFTGKAPTITMEVRRAQDGSVTVDEDTLTDAVVFGLTGDNALGKRFREEVGENPGAFDQDISNQWLNQQIQAGNLKVSEVDGRIFVQGNVPVENYVKNRLDAYVGEGAAGVARVTSEMKEQTAQYERLAAEQGYGRRVLELRAQADKAKDAVTKQQLSQQADALEAELEARYPTDWLDETWRGFKTGLARGSYNLTRTAANVKGLVEAFNMSDKEMVEATKRDKRVRAMEAALNSETPQARRWLGQAAEAVTSELIYSPMYIAGGMMMGPAGGIMTSALRSANKPMDEALQDIAASVFELASGNLIKGKWLVGTGISPRKEFLAEMGAGGFGEAGGDALIDLAQGKGIDWNNALMNLVIGGGMEAGFGAREALKGQHRPEGEGEVGFDTASAGAVQFDTEVRSPVFITRGEDGQPRFGAVVRQGESVGFIEIPNQHPIIMKHTIDVEEGKASFVATEPESFDAAMTEWKGTSEGIKLPRLNAAQLAAYLRGENPLVTAERDAKLKANIEGGVNEETESSAGQDDLQEDGTNVVLPGTQQEQVQGQVQVEPQGKNGQTDSAGKGQGNEQVLEVQPKTYRRYRSKDFPSVDHALDVDLAKQWDEAKAVYDEAYRTSANAGPETKPGIAIKAGHVFTDARRQILKEQAKRDAEAEKTKAGETKPKQTTTPGEKPFEAGRLITVGKTQIRLPEDLGKRWQKVQDDYKRISEEVRDDKTINLLERQKRGKEANEQRVAEQNRIVNEYRARENESEKRGYLKDSDRPLQIMEDKGDELVVKLAGEDATRVVGRDQIETRKERALKNKKNTKLPLIVRTKASLGTFTEGKTASYASDGVVYINNTTQSKIEDALGESMASGFTFHSEAMPEVVKSLKSAGLTKIANQLESQTEAAGGRPALVNVNASDPALTMAHERIHQKANGKDLPRSAAERLFQEGTALDKLYNEIDKHPIKGLNAYDGIQEVLAFGLTGDYEGLGVEPDTLYDALLDVVEAYIMAFPNEDLDTIFENAVVDIDSIKNEANRRIKYGEQNKQASGKNTVQATGDKTKGGAETGSDADTKAKVRQKERSKYGLQRGEDLTPVRDVFDVTGKSALQDFEVEVHKNPDKSAVAKMLKGYKADNPARAKDSTADMLRSSTDSDGNIYVWRADTSALHDDIAMSMRQNYGVKLGRQEFKQVKELNDQVSNRMGFARQTVEDYIDTQGQIQEIKRKPIEEVTKDDIKTVVTGGKFAAISGGTKTAQLKNEIDRMGYKVFDAEGVTDGESEPSLFVILNTDKDAINMMRLARRFNQENVILGDSGAYRAPFVETNREAYSAKSKAVFGSTAEKQPGSTIVQLPMSKIAFSIPDVLSDTRKRSSSETREVAEMTRSYEKSFENKAKANTADLTTFLQEQADAGKRKNRSVAGVAKFLEATVKEMYGDYPNSNMKEGDYDAIRTRRGVADLLAILEHEFNAKKTDDATGLTWYNSTIKKMHQRTGQAFPEVLSQPQMRLLYDLTLAMSSPSNTVQSNYNYATKIWQRMIDEFDIGLDGGRVFPTKQKQYTTNPDGSKRLKRYGRFGSHLDKFNNLSQGFIPVDAKTAETLKKKGVEVKQTTDFAGVAGAQQWYAKDKELNRNIKKYGHIGGVFEYLLQPGTEANEPYRATEVLGPKVGAFFLNIAGFGQLVTVDSWVSRWFYMLNGGLVNKADKKGIQDAPKSTHDGDIIRGIMQATAKEWNKKHGDVLSIKPDDVQAVAWYHIKNIFHLAGARDSGHVDFAQAAERTLSDEDIVHDIDGSAAYRSTVLKRFANDAPALGPRASVAGTSAAGKENRDFFTQQMAMPARMGLARTKRKEIVNKKLSNFDSVEWNKFIERAKGEALNPEEKTHLFDLLQKGYQSTTDKQRLKVKEEIIDFANNLSSQNLADFVLTVRKAGMLSGIKTTGRNILSNLAFGILEETQRGIAGPLDMALTAYTGTPRTTQGISPTAIFKAAFGKEGAFRDGLVKFKDTMMKGNADLSTFEDIGYDPKLRPYLSVFGKKIPFATGAWFMNKSVGNFAKFVFRFQKAQDVFFRTYAYNRAMYEVAALKEKNEKVPIADTLANPTAEESDVAWRAAEVMVFQNENGMNTAYQRFKSKQPKAVKYLLDYQLPFIKTGTNIFSKTLDYLGVGGAYKILKLSGEMNDAEWAKGKSKLKAAIENPEARKIIVDAFSRGLVGAGIASIGWFLAAAGMLNGMDDDDEKERNRRIAQGSGPGHLRVNDTWVDIRGVSPVGTILLSGASAYRAFTKDLKDESKRYDAMLAVASSILVDGLPLARAASDYVNPKSGRSVAQRLIGAESVVPAIVSEIGAAKDKFQRNTKGDTLVETVKNSVKSRIPVVRESLPAKTDVFGRELEETSPSPLVPIAGALSPKAAKDDKVVTEASEVGWSMTPPKRDTKNNETAEVFEKRKKKTQDLIYKLFDKVVSDKNYASDYTKPERKEILDEAAGIARRTIKANGTLTNTEIKEIVELVLEKAKEQSEIERDTKMDKDEKAKAKQAISTMFAPGIGGPTKD